LTTLRKDVIKDDKRGGVSILSIKKEEASASLPEAKFLDGGRRRVFVLELVNSSGGG
jgi:hypothetical protein